MLQNSSERIQMRLTFTHGHRLFPELMEMNGDTHAMRLRVYELIARGLHEEAMDIGNAISRTLNDTSSEPVLGKATNSSRAVLPPAQETVLPKNQNQAIPSFEIGFLTNNQTN